MEKFEPSIYWNLDNSSGISEKIYRRRSKLRQSNRQALITNLTKFGRRKTPIKDLLNVI